MGQNWKPDLPSFKGRSPIGTAVYPRLSKPDFKFNDKGLYSIRLRLSAIDATPLRDSVDSMVEEATRMSQARLDRMVKGKPVTVVSQSPYKFCVDDQDQPTGELEFSFKLVATGKDDNGETFTRTPKLFGPDGALLPEGVVIGAGSQVRVSYRMVPYFMAAQGEQSPRAGVTLYLNAVQVAELKEPGTDAAEYDFDVIEGAEPISAPARRATAHVPADPLAGTVENADDDVGDADFL